jgi:hypothetical protein
MAGTFFVAIAIQLLSIAWSFYEYRTGKTTQEHLVGSGLRA